jgi:hypothetical protein
VNSDTAFPVRFNSLACKSGGKAGPYVIGAMFTASYAEKAERLAASCRTFELPYVIHQVPTIHRSINGRVGSDDLSVTKANFIRHLLDEYRKPVLYLDVDCEFVSRPDLLDDLVKSECDFAIYNWLADEYTDRFVPIDLAVLEEPSRPNRFYRFRPLPVWLDEISSTGQLVCSGLTQFFANSAAARFLLSEWQRTVARFPASGDDASLCFAFNNLGGRSHDLRVQWLPKPYARISWWIYAKPVIDHRDLPQPDSNFTPLEEPSGRKWVYPERADKRTLVCRIPRDCIIDTERHVLWRIQGNKLIPVGPADQPFWL